MKSSLIRGRHHPLNGDNHELSQCSSSVDLFEDDDTDMVSLYFSCLISEIAAVWLRRGGLKIHYIRNIVSSTLTSPTYVLLTQLVDVSLIEKFNGSNPL